MGPISCKGCSKIISGALAYRLLGNHWHFDCFRCSSCSTLLDPDAELLLLDDGSLVCTNCIYICSSCGTKTKDNAIITADQAFCKACFKCRNCQRALENLRYARTSQGIFCMDCHDVLIERRRMDRNHRHSQLASVAVHQGSW